METASENKATQPARTKTSGPAYKYVGDGHTFVMGLPAADLTSEDVAGMSDAQRDLLKAHSGKDGLYSKGDK